MSYPNPPPFYQQQPEFGQNDAFYGQQPPHGYPQQPPPGYSQGYQQPYSGAPQNNFQTFPPQLIQGDLMQTVVQSPFTHLVSDYVGANLAEKKKYVESNMDRWIADYKYYFNVNNSYVLNKIKILLFPLRHKSWARRIAQQNGAEIYLPPRDDVNAPDLYIPVMALITFVILHGFVMGTTNRFTPEILGRTATTSLFSILFEVLLIKFGFYLLSDNAVPVSILDLFSYSGYIFVGITFNTLVGILFGKLPYYASTFLMSIFMGIFMVKTFRILIIDRGLDGNPNHSNFRNYFIVSVAFLQILLSFFLGVVA